MKEKVLNLIKKIRSFFKSCLKFTKKVQHFTISFLKFLVKVLHFIGKILKFLFSLIKPILKTKWGKVIFTVLAISLVSFGGFKAFVHGKRIYEKKQCLKRMPWQTLEGITLCDTIWEAQKKVGGVIEYRSQWYDYSVDIVDINSDNKKYITTLGNSNGKIYAIMAEKRYVDNSPNYKTILQRLITKNGEPNISTNRKFFKDDIFEYRWCWGGCEREENKDSWTGYSIHCIENSQCLIFKFLSTLEKYTITIEAVNDLLNNELKEYRKQKWEIEKQQKANEF